MTTFTDRRDAGQQLAQELKNYTRAARTLVLALPRGGVPVGYEVAHALHLPLDVFVVRKIGAPEHEELGVGALASGGTQVINDALLADLGLTRASISDTIRRETKELARREQLYRHGRPALDVRGMTVIVVDDGLATGASMFAAIEALRSLLAERIVVAVPVGAQSTCQALANIADEVVCCSMPENFQAVGAWYDDFTQTTDEEVQALLAA